MPVPTDRELGRVLVEETNLAIDVRAWREEGLRLLARDSRSLDDTERRRAGAAAIEDAVREISADRDYVAPSTPRPVKGVVSMEQEPPGPVYRRRDIIVASLALAAVTLLGGFIFTALELETELRHARNARVEPYETFVRILPRLEQEDRDWILRELYQSATLEDYRCGECKDFQDAYVSIFALEGVADLEKELGKICRSPEALKHCNWRVYGSTYFTLTCFTTIGYGNFTPQTAWGRFFVVVVTICGMVAAFPLFSAIGERLLLSLRRQPITANQMGIILAGAFSIFILLGAWYFLYFDLLTGEVDYAKALYWSFVTLSTLGLGDFVPKTSNAHAVFAFFVYVIAGISLLSLVIQFLQERSLPSAVTGAEDGPTLSMGPIERYDLASAPAAPERGEQMTMAPGMQGVDFGFTN